MLFVYILLLADVYVLFSEPLSFSFQITTDIAWSVDFDDMTSDLYLQLYQSSVSYVGLINFACCFYWNIYMHCIL